MQIRKIRPDDITNLLRAKNSLFNKFIEIGNLREAALIANAILLTISQETSMDLQKKYKVLFKSNLLIKKFKKYFILIMSEKQIVYQEPNIQKRNKVFV